MNLEKISLSTFKKPQQLDKSVTEELNDITRRENIIKAEKELARLKKDPSSNHIKLDLKDINTGALSDEDKEAFYEAFSEKIDHKGGWDQYSEGFKEYDENAKKYTKENGLDSLEKIMKDPRANFAGMIRQHVVLKTMKKIIH